ncbi:uncharacterized protein LOC112055441 [Bicyclus anynana]|uniref:Uncharacterized protein LOC112055441 n=1 Tax=Bicyclus anynana TaxID=110368 RepID=A0A6J1P0Q4_BICAN|nr:uncharacterized protein LOC112055441 [Bicyclus anynana]
MQCCVPFCETSSASERKGITFHRFPSDTCLRAAWHRALGTQNLQQPLPDAAVVCSLHFLDDHFYETAACVRQIHTDAIPSTVQMCMICLDSDSKLFLMSKHKLEEAYQQLIGMPLCVETNLQHAVCVLCAQRLSNFSRLRDLSLRARSLMMDLIQKYGLITMQHVNVIKQTMKHLNYNLVSTASEPDHCNLYIYQCDEQTPEDNVNKNVPTDVSIGTWDIPIFDTVAVKREIDQDNVNDDIYQCEEKLPPDDSVDRNVATVVRKGTSNTPIFDTVKVKRECDQDNVNNDLGNDIYQCEEQLPPDDSVDKNVATVVRKGPCNIPIFDTVKVKREIDQDNINNVNDIYQCEERLPPDNSVNRNVDTYVKKGTWDIPIFDTVVVKHEIDQDNINNKDSDITMEMDTFNTDKCNVIDTRVSYSVPEQMSDTNIKCESETFTCAQCFKEFDQEDEYYEHLRMNVQDDDNEDTDSVQACRPRATKSWESYLHMGSLLQITSDVVEHDDDQMEDDDDENPPTDHVRNPRKNNGVRLDKGSKTTAEREELMTSQGQQKKQAKTVAERMREYRLRKKHGLSEGPKTSSERGREFRSRRAMLKQHQEVVEIGEDIKSAEVRKMEKRAKSAEATRRCREKKNALMGHQKKRPKTVAERMREYRARKKLEKQEMLRANAACSSDDSAHSVTPLSAVDTEDIEDGSSHTSYV